jgi:pyruvate/2-oxoglutarate dehydrogenase complex dihydrolipoamide acyltransferase (E2) component
MAKAYTPGLKVSARTLYRARRLLPVHGEVLVKAGDAVKSRDVVARTYIEGDVTPVAVASQLSVPAGDVPSLMLVKPGDTVAAGQPIARSKGIFGFGKKELAAPAAGTVESISATTGQVILRGAPLAVEVKAYVDGRVTEVLPGEGAVVEADAVFVQGIFGVGGETVGPIRVACSAPGEVLDAAHIAADMKGCVVLGGARITAAAVKAAQDAGVAALVAGGIDDADLKAILGYDLGVAITGTERIGLTIVVTEGFGDIAMAERTHGLLKSFAGREASVNGATQIRAGVMRPEIVVARTAADPAPQAGARPEEGALEIGTQVRLIRDPYFGLIGGVAALPSEPAVLGSGSKARVLEVALADGRRVTVPRANIELIET